MLDRYEPTLGSDRNREDSHDRDRGSAAAETPLILATVTSATSSRRTSTCPRGRERRPVRERDRALRLSTSPRAARWRPSAAFRVVAESDLHDLRDDSLRSRRSLKHFENEGLIARRRSVPTTGP